MSWYTKFCGAVGAFGAVKAKSQQPCGFQALAVVGKGKKIGAKSGVSPQN